MLGRFAGLLGTTSIFAEKVSFQYLSLRQSFLILPFVRKPDGAGLADISRRCPIC